MPPKNNFYNEVILNDPTLTVDNPVAGHEIQVVVGSPSKVTVEPIELQDLPPLGEPRHIEGDLTAWILE